MASFKSGRDADGRVAVDWSLMQNSAVTLFEEPNNFDYALSWLERHGYEIHRIDASDPWRFKYDMTTALSMRELYDYEWEGDLDNLNSIFGDLKFDDVTGVAFAFTNFEQLASTDYRLAHQTLDIIEWNSRFFLLLGRRLMALVLCADSKLEFKDLGARKAMWNTIRWVAPRIPS